MSDPKQTRVIERTVRLTVQQLSRRVHLRLGQLNMTMKDVGERMGVSGPLVSRAVNAEDMTTEMFDRLSNALEVTAEWWEKPIGRTFDDRPDPAAALMQRVRDISGG